MTVNDFSDMFVPLVDGFLVRLEESGAMFDKLLQEIPKIFADARQTDTILYPAIQAGMRALEVPFLFNPRVFSFVQSFLFRLIFFHSIAKGSFLLLKKYF